jgi:hypothetical protein
VGTKEFRSKTRFNLELTPKTKEKLQDLQARSDASSSAEVVRRALDLYDRILRHQQANGEILLVTPGAPGERVWILI